MKNKARLPATPGRGNTPRPADACSDAELIIQVRARGLGWKLAFNVLLGRHREWLTNHCSYRLGNRQDGQDVCQQVMLRAWQAIDRFEGRSAFRTWLYSIAENQCRSFAVKRMRYIQTEHIEKLVDLYRENSLAGFVEQHAQQEAIATALQNVNDREREVLMLRFFHDRSLEEIATTLAISLSAAKMRLYRSLDHFRVEYLQVTGGHTSTAQGA